MCFVGDKSVCVCVCVCWTVSHADMWDPFALTQLWHSQLSDAAGAQSLE